ncbi:MAG: hypothetical protein ACLFTV_08995 [Desulfococcaceae bacterium]
MKPITSPESFKTCFIAQVKEEMGFAVRKAHNRRGNSRKITVRAELRPFIEKAINQLRRTGNKFPTYKQIQNAAFNLYRESTQFSEVDRLYGSFASDDPEEAISIIEDKNMFYEI